MTLPEPPLSDDDIRFPSLESLRAVHTELLKKFRVQGAIPEVTAEIEGFIRRGKATGAVLDIEADRWAAQSQLDYWTTQLYRPGYEPPDSTLDDYNPQLAPELADDLCPYVGLDTFRESNRSLFFGRKHLIDELIEKFKSVRFLAVVGPSGSGKSSVVRAGLIPELKQGAVPDSATWIYFPTMVPGSKPLINLARLLMPRNANTTQVEQEAELYLQNSNHLMQMVSKQFANTVVLVVDQFEEIFTLCTDQLARHRFVENLINLCQSPNVGHRVILTMRSDFEPNLVIFPELQSLFEDAVVRITPLNASELREAIEAPATHIGLKFQEDVINALLSDTLGEPAGLPLLQFTLLKLWENRDHNRITWEAYKKLGGGRQALARSADEFYHQLIPEEQVTLRRILLKMVRPGEGLEVTSNRVPRYTLYRNAEANDRVDRVLDKLIQARLIRISEGDIAADEQLEVTHEALIRNWPRLVTWLEDERVSLRQRQRLTSAATEWDRLGKDTSALWRGNLLRETKQYDDLSELEIQFIEVSSEVERLEAYRQIEDLRKLAATERRSRLVTNGLLIIAFILIVVLSYSPIRNEILRQQAEKSQQISIESGEYFLGDQRANDFPDEYLPLQVYQISAFSIDAYPVNNRRYLLCMQAGVCSRPKSYRSEYEDPKNFDKPVVNIDVIDAAEFCFWVGMQLPSEKEWETATRQGVIELTNDFYEWTSSSYSMNEVEWKDITLDPPDALAIRGVSSTDREVALTLTNNAIIGFRCVQD